MMQRIAALLVLSLSTAGFANSPVAQETPLGTGSITFSFSSDAKPISISCDAKYIVESSHMSLSSRGKGKWDGAPGKPVKVVVTLAFPPGSEAEVGKAFEAGKQVNKVQIRQIRSTPSGQHLVDDVEAANVTVSDFAVASAGDHCTGSLTFSCPQMGSTRTKVANTPEIPLTKE